MISSMAHIFPAQKVKVDPLAAHERFVVCVRDQDGALRITGLRRYLKRRSRRRPPRRPDDVSALAPKERA